MADLSVVIPARNEPYLQPTIDDILSKARGDTEVIVILDGYWPNPPLKDNDKLRIIHRGESRGMRDAITSAVEMSQSKYIMKLDAHCMLSEGFDLELMKASQPNWVQVPVRKRLLPETWEIEEVPGRPDVAYMYLTYPYADAKHDIFGAGDKQYGLHGKNWDTLNKREDLKSVMIDDLMTCQGSAYFMERAYFKELELLDQSTYGGFRDEFLEVGMKCWLSGGRVVVNKNCWYAHWHKNKGRGYSLPPEPSQWERWMGMEGWHKQTLPIKWLVEKFDEKNGKRIWPDEFYESK
jgi:glycosyltransferase involved in cell wall biosynthesis